jgi:very-short-patch-repair endonuclease
MNDHPRTLGTSGTVLSRLLEEARTRLIETGARNRLIHTPRNTKRSKSVTVVGANPDEVFSLLVRKGTSLSFLSAPDEKQAEDSDSSTQLAPLPLDERMPAGSGKLQTRLTAEGLQKRLLGLFRDARTLEEEQGVNILFLAVGFLRWFEDERSEIVREAPLILIPVTLTRSNARSSFRLAAREEDLTANLPLQERLRQFGIVLPIIPDTDDWTPANYFASVRNAIGEQPRWSIDEQGMMLGFFSFSKFLMFRDLDSSNWPNGGLLTHQILSRLLVDGFPAEAPLFPDEFRLDEAFDPGQLIHVVDADSAQTLVIETVRQGQSLVVQGPPGTGKSQTITNLIAAAVHDGKRVLFIAEKMAALDVVYDRLVKAGLRDVCLELHSRQANKRAFLQEIERTLRSAGVGSPGDKEATRLRILRTYLNETAARLHVPLNPSGVTPYRALGQQVKLLAEGHPPPNIGIPDSVNWTEPQAREVAEQITRLAQLTAAFGPKNRHAWRGVTVLHLQPADSLRLATKLRLLSQKSAHLASALREVSVGLGFQADQPLGAFVEVSRLLTLVAHPPPVDPKLLRSVGAANDVPRLTQAIQKARKAATLWSPLADAFATTPWNFDFAAIRRGIQTGTVSWGARLHGPYRQASRMLASVLSKPLPKTAKDRLSLIDGFLQVRQLCAELDRDDDFCKAILGEFWQDLHTDFASVEQAIGWIEKLSTLKVRPSILRCIGLDSSLEQLASRLDNWTRELRDIADEVVAILGLDVRSAFGVPTLDEMSIFEIERRAAAWSSNPAGLNEWSQLAIADRVVRENGAGSIADLLATAQLPPEGALAEFLFARSEALWKMAISRDPKLAEMTGEERSRFVTEFRALEHARRGLVAQEVCARHRAGIVPGGVGEKAIILGEIAKQRGHMPIRTLVQRAGPTLQSIKPVFLMSPLSASQFLKPGAVKFDLLIIDEASQIRPEDALGAIARADQIVVVGDKRQLPPTSFFDRLIDDNDGDEDEDEESEALSGAASATEMESILTVCEARGMSERMLTWHYRSRHASLIEVSNAEFYASRLFLPPSPQVERGETGLIVHRIEGAYDRGGKRTNESEARAVVEAIARHVRGSPNLSLGVATFSVSQRDLIEDMLEMKRRDDPELDGFMTNSKQEPVFVKNLENVQGDERDAIIISVGYGPRIPGMGLDSMHFGPVSAEGGERRLNVLFTRARVRCEVFASFNSGDIDLTRTTKQGARVLKRFLRFAETGTLDLPAPTMGEADSPFEEAVAQAITELGFSVDAQVGSAGFRIDLAVKHPTQKGRYILAVECDGATYHSARWARKRDRLRQEILENMGWSFHRIWSTDWFYNAKKEQQKLAQAISLASSRY